MSKNGINAPRKRRVTDTIDDYKHKLKKLKLDKLDVKKETKLSRSVKKMYCVRAFCPSRNMYKYIGGRGRFGEKEVILVEDLHTARLYLRQCDASRSLVYLKDAFDRGEFILEPLGDPEIACLLVTIEEAQ